MAVEPPSYNWTLGPTHGDSQHLNVSDEELMKLQMEIIRNFTRMYGSSALDPGQLSGDVLRHPLLRVVVVSIFVVVIAADDIIIFRGLRVDRGAGEITSASGGWTKEVRRRLCEIQTRNNCCFNSLQCFALTLLAG